ncbi:MAG: 4-hydroxy-3-methylbut-2-enyl diphosphate reductase [Candidatus Latescibacterota bacterium]|nr:MAG: 4-hydroxy-3-methylbut-2-enyl diphosphate reductase [Candidatus Latescibacterota bacterium]
MNGDKHIRSDTETRGLAGLEMARVFRSPIVEHLRRNDFRIRSGDTAILLAAEFGFCYGVDRAVEYAFAASHRYAGRRLWITGEIIHNPRVNRHLREMGIGFLPEAGTLEERFRELRAGDVVLIPAFGADAREMAYLHGNGYEIVDTTCGSVLNVWKRVRQYARDGFTSIIHGKYDHEETAATCSQVLAANPDGKYVVVRDMEETGLLADRIAGRGAPDLESRFAKAASAGFDPDRDLGRIGLANQTTMLESESRTIQEVLRAAMAERCGEADLAGHFRAFDTICSATEDRQRAVKHLLERGLDRMVVIGGFNSSNTGHLVEIAESRVPTYHIESVEGIVDRETIRAKPQGGGPVLVRGWLPDGPLTIGITGGASTPDSVVGRVIEKIMELRGMSAPEAAGAA